MPVLHFKSKEGYRKNMAFRHMNNLPDTASEVYVAGKRHAVKHSTDPKRVKIDNAQRKKEAREGGDYKRHWSQVKTGGNK